MKTTIMSMKRPKRPHGTQTPSMISLVTHAMSITKAGMTIQIVIMTEIRKTRFLTFCYNQHSLSQIRNKTHPNLIRT